MESWSISCQMTGIKCWQNRCKRPTHIAIYVALIRGFPKPLSTPVRIVLHISGTLSIFQFDIRSFNNFKIRNIIEQSDD